MKAQEYSSHHLFNKETNSFWFKTLWC